MSTSSPVSLADINNELLRTPTASINMNDNEVRHIANQSLSTVATQTFTSTGTWTAPTGVTSVEYVVVAGGGSGGRGDPGWGQGAGGGGGGFVRGRYTVTPGTTYTVTIGGGGAAVGSGKGADGGDSFFGITTATPKSFYFNGSSSITVGNALTLDTSDFTIEFFMYNNTTAVTNQAIFSGEYSGAPSGPIWGIAFITYGGFNGLTFSYGQYGSYVVGKYVAGYWGRKAWTHIVWQRRGGVFECYIDGALQTLSTYNENNTFTDSINLNTNTTNKYIGQSVGGGNYFNGYLSNIRVVKGNAVYTSNFIPPTAPLTAISNTALLTALTTSFTDSSTNGYTITQNGSMSSNYMNPFTAIMALGGGAGGGTAGDPARSGNHGGCGGGASNFGTLGRGTVVQGFDGNSSSTGAPEYGGGGGGGAFKSGDAGTTAVGGAGGTGRFTSLSGSLETFAGGGGGSAVSAPGSGGAGGGGAGGTNSGNASSGTTNTGGGGGGGTSGYTAGNGGSGRVILRWYAPASVSGTTVDMNAMRNLSPPIAGTNYGFTAGGGDPSAQRVTNIERIPFSTDTSSTNVGNLSQARASNYGHNNEVAGWASAGIFNPPAGPVNSYTSIIEKFPFASTSSVSTVGYLDRARIRGMGTSSRTHGYAVSGWDSWRQTGAANSPITLANGLDSVERFSFANESQQATVATLVSTTQGGVGAFATLAYGFRSGGTIDPANNGSVSNIDRFPFATDSVACTQVGTLTQARGLTTGASSPLHGYTIAGLQVPATRYTTIDRFSFFSGGNAVSVGNLNNPVGISSGGGISSVNNGYHVGGATNVPVPGGFQGLSAIHKFPFSSSTSSTVIGNLLSNRIQMATISD